MNAKAVEWHRVLMEHPDCAEQCDWELVRKEWAGQFGRWYWDVLLMHHPQFADYCDWSKLTLGNWQELLFCKPEFRRQLESKTSFSYEECHVDEFEPI